MDRSIQGRKEEQRRMVMELREAVELFNPDRFYLVLKSQCKLFHLIVEHGIHSEKARDNIEEVEASLLLERFRHSQSYLKDNLILTIRGLVGVLRMFENERTSNDKLQSSLLKQTMTVPSKERETEFEFHLHYQKKVILSVLKTGADSEETRKDLDFLLWICSKHCVQGVGLAPIFQLTSRLLESTVRLQSDLRRHLIAQLRAQDEARAMEEEAKRNEEAMRAAISSEATRVRSSSSLASASSSSPLPFSSSSSSSLEPSYGPASSSSSGKARELHEAEVSSLSGSSPKRRKLNSAAESVPASNSDDSSLHNLTEDDDMSNESSDEETEEDETSSSNTPPASPISSLDDPESHEMGDRTSAASPVEENDLLDQPMDDTTTESNESEGEMEEGESVSSLPATPADDSSGAVGDMRDEMEIADSSERAAVSNKENFTVAPSSSRSSPKSAKRSSKNNKKKQAPKKSGRRRRVKAPIFASEEMRNASLNALNDLAVKEAMKDALSNRKRFKHTSLSLSAFDRAAIRNYARTVMKMARPKEKEVREDQFIIDGAPYITPTPYRLIGEKEDSGTPNGRLEFFDASEEQNGELPNYRFIGENVDSREQDLEESRQASRTCTFQCTCDPDKGCKLETCECMQQSALARGRIDVTRDKHIVVECCPSCPCEQKKCPSVLKLRKVKVQTVYWGRQMGFVVRVMENVQRGEPLMEFTGERTARQLGQDDRWSYTTINVKDKKWRKLVGNAAVNSFLNPRRFGNSSRHIPHSNMPNVDWISLYQGGMKAFDARSIVFALEPLEAGDILYFSYGKDFGISKEICACSQEFCHKRSRTNAWFRKLTFQQAVTVMERRELAKRRRMYEKELEALRQ